jgi:opacity protein-like surface antigen
MQKIILLLAFIPCLLHAQRMHVDLFGGFSNYQGDLQDKMFTTEQAKAAFGAGLKYDLTTHLSLRTNFTYASLSAADKYNRQADLRARNLSFQTKITEVNLLLDYSLRNLENHKITPYVFAGIAVFHYNPYAYDSVGNKIYLKPLSTEGQGLTAYPTRKPYHLTQFAIPFGGGIRWKFTDNVIISYEIGLRKTFTDYLDDISTTYVDQAVLATAKGSKAVEMAYRGAELKTGQPYPADGTIRGGAKFRDWYYFSGINVSIGINNGKTVHRFDKGRGSTACPPRVM